MRLKRHASPFRHGFAAWIGYNFVFIIVEWFIGNLQLPLVKAFISFLATLSPPITYWDVVTPFWLLFLFATFWIFIVRRGRKTDA